MRNFHSRMGEIDLIATHRRGDVHALHFVEVRYRATDRFGGAEASITPAKQEKIRRTAALFLQRHQRFRNHRAQFDVITVSGTNYPPCVRWIESAF